MLRIYRIMTGLFSLGGGSDSLRSWPPPQRKKSSHDSIFEAFFTYIVIVTIGAKRNEFLFRFYIHTDFLVREPVQPNRNAFQTLLSQELTTGAKWLKTQPHIVTTFNTLQHSELLNS